jgi:hypothetical protein
MAKAAGADLGGQFGAGLCLEIGGDGIFEIEDDGIAIEAAGLGQGAGIAGRHVEHRAQRARSSIKSCLLSSARAGLEEDQADGETELAFGMHSGR